MYSCDSNADCINTVGSYSCQCRNGYTGDGRVCTGNFRRISDIFRYANYVTAGIYFRYISIRQLCHSWYMLYNSLFVETPRKFITNYYMFYRHANIQRTGICYVLLSPLLDINECSTQTYTCDQCGLH